MSARLGFVALLIGAASVIWIAQRGADELHRFRSTDPRVWEADIAQFERDAAEAPASVGAITIIGASTIRFWETAAEDLAPFDVMRRGFGGAKLADVSFYAERLVTPKPIALVLSIGGNDLFEFAGSDSAAPEEAAAACVALLEKFQTLLPDVPIYYVAIRPPILDAQGRDPSSKVNQLLRAFADATAGIEFIDANVRMYDDDGQLRDGLRAWDGSQLSTEGYVAWSAPIRDRLVRDLGGPESSAAQ